MRPLFFRALKAQLVFLITSLLLFTVGCENDDHDDHDHDAGHTDADGFVLETEGEVEMWKEFEGAIVTDNLTLAVGDTLELKVHFLDHDGAEITHDEHDDHDDHEGEEEEESTLSITENDATIAIVAVEEHHEESGSEEHHDEMGIEVIGVSAGTTNFKLRLMHGDHADYTSVNNVKVTVTAAAN